MDNFTWNNCTVESVSNNGTNYIYNLLYDYEKYVKDYGYVDLNSFIQEWTCIPYMYFAKLCAGDIVYLCNGEKYIIADESYRCDDDTCLYIEAIKAQDDGTFDISDISETMISGDLYYAPVIHRDYLWKKKIKKESEEKLCPILITRTNQLQN
jgi:hypothetical protein